jgi:hypothetical protein
MVMTPLLEDILFVRSLHTVHKEHSEEIFSVAIPKLLNGFRWNFVVEVYNKHWSRWPC